MEQLWQLIRENLGELAMALSAVFAYLGLSKSDRKKLLKKIAKKRLKAQKQVEKLKKTNEQIEQLEKETEKNA